MKILMAVDGSACTRRMLAYVAAHEEFLSAAHEYTILTVTPHVPPRVTGYFDRATLEGYYRDQAEEILGPVRAFAKQQPWKSEFVSRVGHAPDVIAELAKQGHFDLIVMGSHGHSSLGGAVLGSVTTRVLGHCQTPVLVIR